jgi:hypothetical protein
MRFLFIGRDGHIPEGVVVPVTGNGQRGSAAKPAVTGHVTKRDVRHKHEPGKHASNG